MPPTVGCARLHTLGSVDLRDRDGVPSRAVLAQPRRLALLIRLAADPAGFLRRDILLATFWPEASEHDARSALNRAVWFLRSALNHDALVSRGSNEVGVDRRLLWCDAVALDTAVAAGKLEEAVDLHRGDFLAGFYINGAPAFERWVESERTRLRGLAVQAALGLVDRSERTGDLRSAADWARRASLLVPHDELAVQRRIHLLDLAGDRAGALETYDDFTARLRAELDLEPSPETRALAAAVRRRRESGAATAAAAPWPRPTGEDGRPAPDNPLPHPPPASRDPAYPCDASRPLSGHRTRVGLGVAALLVGGALALATLVGRPSTLRLGPGRAVAASIEPEQWPTVSADGRTLVYARGPAGAERLFAQQLDGGAPVAISNSLPGPQRFGALSPDGTRVLFQGPDGLYIMPTSGGWARRVAAGVVGGPRGLGWGAWAPDGVRIAYTDRDTLFLLDSRTGATKPAATGVLIHSPAWSPDGRWIGYVEGNPLFHLLGNTAPSAVLVVPARGGRPVAVTSASALNTSPVWLPGRRALLFISDRDGTRDIYRVDLAADGLPVGAPIRITTGLEPDRLSLSREGRQLVWSVFTQSSNLWSLDVPAHDSLPISQARRLTAETHRIEAAASADSTWLYFDSDRSGTSHLWRVPLAGGALEQLTLDSAWNFYPAVSPDGREVAFHAHRDADRDVYLMSLADRAPVRLSASPGEEAAPAWSPDGRAIVWVDGGHTLRIARRQADGSWQAPSALTTGSRLGAPSWSPEGRWISFASPDGLVLFDPATGHRRIVPGGGRVFWHTWAADSRTIFGIEASEDGRNAIVALPVDGRPRKVMVYADVPATQQFGYGLVVARGRFYFGLVEQKADVWVAGLEGRP